MLKFLSIALLSLALHAQAPVFSLDATHSKMAFKASTLLFDVPGQFDRYTVTVHGDPATLAGASVRVDLEAASVNTQNKDRDKHLRTADFFDAAKYPRIVFASTKIWQEGAQLMVQGDLTLHGVTRSLTLPFTAAQGLNGAGSPTWSYRATLPLNRLDYGLGADSVAAKISLRNAVELDLLLVGFFQAAPTKR